MRTPVPVPVGVFVPQTVSTVTLCHEPLIGGGERRGRARGGGEEAGVGAGGGEAGTGARGGGEEAGIGGRGEEQKLEITSRLCHFGYKNIRIIIVNKFLGEIKLLCNM